MDKIKTDRVEKAKKCKPFLEFLVSTIFRLELNNNLENNLRGETFNYKMVATDDF